MPGQGDHLEAAAADGDRVPLLDPTGHVHSGLLGDGGSMYSIHSVWTAAHYEIPVVFICVVNHEYEILKQLWKLQVPDSSVVMRVDNFSHALRMVQAGLGIASLPDYMSQETSTLVEVLPELRGPSLDAYFVYPEKLRQSQKIIVFRDFLLRKVAESPL